MQRSLLGLIAVGALALSGCGPAPVATTPPPTAGPTDLVAETEVSIPNPTLTPVTPLPADLPPNLPVDFTPNELAAARAGKANYSGYSCNFSKDGCTCDQPTIQSVTFTFQPGNKMSYQFMGDTYGAQWEMTRISPDQWSYTLRIAADETGGATPTGAGSFFFVLAFTADGFKIAQREDLGGGQVITCPEVVFARMAQP